jgi:hypothetical protein
MYYAYNVSVPSSEKYRELVLNSGHVDISIYMFTDM